MQIDLMLVDRALNLVEEGIDVAVRIGRLTDSSLVAVPVGEVRRVVVASPGLLRDSGPLKHPRNLRELPCVRITGLAPNGSWTFVDRGRTLSVKVGGPLVCNQAAASVDACLNGLGFGMFLSYQVRDDLAARRLKEVLADFAPAPLPVNLVYPHARLLSSRVRAFIDFTAEELRRSLGRE
jgi:DNA-binding transcriptional LysR family regulator